MNVLLHTQRTEDRRIRSCPLPSPAQVTSSALKMPGERAPIRQAQPALRALIRNGLLLTFTGLAWVRILTVVGNTRALLGDETLQEEFLTCAAGTLVIAHHHIVHRGSRRSPGIWRPMHAIRNVVRAADPIAPTWYHLFQSTAIHHDCSSQTHRE
jgi:hypothetical protein